MTWPIERVKQAQINRLLSGTPAEAITRYMKRRGYGSFAEVVPECRASVAAGIAYDYRIERSL